MGNQREIWISAGAVGVLFLCLFLYLGHFVATSEQDMINNSYNSRQQILLSRNYRGSIYSRDGEVLAETILNDRRIPPEKRTVPKIPSISIRIPSSFFCVFWSEGMSNVKVKSIISRKGRIESDRRNRRFR